MRLNLRTLTGKNIHIEAEPSDTVESVKLQIQTAELILVSQQRLYVHSKVMEDDKTLADYSVNRDTCIILLAARPPAASEEA
jgi:ubiquitin-large subunit ribosomal protein L40e